MARGHLLFDFTPRGAERDHDSQRQVSQATPSSSRSSGLRRRGGSGLCRRCERLCSSRSRRTGGLTVQAPAPDGGRLGLGFGPRLPDRVRFGVLYSNVSGNGRDDLTECPLPLDGTLRREGDVDVAAVEVSTIWPETVTSASMRRAALSSAPRARTGEPMAQRGKPHPWPRLGYRTSRSERLCGCRLLRT